MPVRIRLYTPLEELSEDMDGAVYMLKYADDAGEFPESGCEAALRDLVDGILNCGLDVQAVDFAVAIVLQDTGRCEVRIALRSGTERVTAAFCRSRLVPPLLLEVGMGSIATALAWVRCEPPFCEDGSRVACSETFGSFEDPLDDSFPAPQEGTRYERSN